MPDPLLSYTLVRVIPQPMKSPPRLPIAALVAAQLCCRVMYAADSKAAASSDGPSGQNDKETDYRLKWNVDTLVGDYEKHGRHNPKWDQSANAALLLFAQVRAFS